MNNCSAFQQAKTVCRCDDFNPYMKIRIKGNSIRFRLTQSETVEFGKKGKIEESIEFGLTENQRLTFVLISDIHAKFFSANSENGRVKLMIPNDIIENWTNSEEVRIKAEQILSPEKTLQILIEKDFTCLVPRTNEDESDNFPHPQSASNFL